jgi:hypothetical protein
MIKTNEKTLEKKAEYYKKNKEKILARKKERKIEIYVNKINRNMSSEKEFEKEFARKLSKYENIRPDACELCGTKQDELDHYLELHHLDYEKTQGVWVCKTCHAELDKVRRRE